MKQKRDLSLKTEQDLFSPFQMLYAHSAIDRLCSTNAVMVLSLVIELTS